MPANPMGLTFYPLADPRVEKLIQTRALIEQKPIGFRVAIANPTCIHLSSLGSRRCCIANLVLPTPRRHLRQACLLDLKERRAVPGLPGHLVRRRLGLPAEAVDRLGQHELVQLLEADVGVRTALLGAVDHLGRRALDRRIQALGGAVRGEEEPELQMWQVLQTDAAFALDTFARVHVVLRQWDVALQEHFDDWL